MNSKTMDNSFLNLTQKGYVSRSIFSAFLFGFSISSFAQTQITKYPADQIKSIEIRNSTGDVNIAVSNSKEAVIVSEKREWGNKCRLDIENKEGRLKIVVTDQAWILDYDCRINFMLSVPKEALMKLRAGSGDVKVVGTRGDIDVKVGSGALSIRADVKRIQALTGSGNIRVDGKVENALIRSSTGNVELSVNHVDPTGRFQIQSGTGDVEVFFQPQALVGADVTTQGGEFINEFGNQKNPKVKIQAQSAQGKISIRKL